MASSVLAAIFARPEPLLLALLVDEQTAGYYAAALKVVDVWTFVPLTFALAMFPTAVRAAGVGATAMAAVLRGSLHPLLAFCVPVSAATCAAAGMVVDVLYGAEFAPAADALRILAWNLVAYAVLEFAWRGLAALGAQRKVVQAQLLAIGVRVGAGAVAIATIGLVGAAASMTGTLVLNAAVLLLFLRGFGIPPSFVALSRRVVAAGVLTAASVSLLTATLPLPLSAPLSILAVCVAVVLGGRFRRADGVALLRAFRPVGSPTPRT
jgi:O-antigen/teichoic acid export membrane protein